MYLEKWYVKGKSQSNPVCRMSGQVEGGEAEGGGRGEGGGEGGGRRMRKRRRRRRKRRRRRRVLGAGQG